MDLWAPMMAGLVRGFLLSLSHVLFVFVAHSSMECGVGIGETIESFCLLGEYEAALKLVRDMSVAYDDGPGG